MAFEINKNILTLEIGNESFTVDPAIAEIHANAARKIILTFNDKMTSGDATTEDIEEAIAKVIEKLECILGDGAIGKIFKEAPISLHDIMDLDMYILGVAGNFEEKKASAYQRIAQNPFKK